jgi:MFS transporter, MHS family, proline/betaine transporter
MFGRASIQPVFKPSRGSLLSIETAAMNFEGAMRRRVVISSILGNALEWFDFTVFGLFVGVLSRLFFPDTDASNSLLKMFATFGVAFAARPLGGIAFGIYADRYGRKQAMVVMISMMAIGTGLIGLLPSYASIGMLAPLLILFARLIQGISAGGEFGSASAMLIEFAPRGLRGLYGSCQTVSQALAFALGASTAYWLSTGLTPQAFESWGWRVPFLLGMLIGPVGFFIRRHVDESPEFRAFLASRADNPAPASLSADLRIHWRPLAVGFCITSAGTAITYVSAIFLPAHATTKLGLPLADAQLGLVLCNLMSAVLAPLSGWLSDRWGRRTVVIPALLLFTALYGWNYSAFLADPNVASLWRLQAVGILLGVLAGPLPALMTEIFPVGLRSTGASISYNFAVMCFGGLAPLFVTALTTKTGNPMVPVYYIAAAVLIGLLGLSLHEPESQDEAVSKANLSILPDSRI